MLNRRKFVSSLALAAAAPALSLSACANPERDAYEEAQIRLRALLSGDPELGDFVRYATLAANGHNTQPWHFTLRENGVRIRPDYSRATPAVDPDDHHLFVSLGCAAENLLIAASAHGRPGAVRFEDGEESRIEVALASGAAGRVRSDDELYRAIPQRQSTRSEYDGRGVPPQILSRLETAAAIDGVSVSFITDEAARETVLDYVVDGNTAQLADPAFVEELLHWIRFNASDALRTGDGLFTRCSGNPEMPGWLGRALFGLFFRTGPENDKYASHIRSSAGIAVFTGAREDREHWVRVGRSFQRFALQATALGLRHAHINQPVEVPAVRRDFAQWLGAAGSRPDLVVRVGYAPPLPMSLRRPLDAVVVPGV